MDNKQANVLAQPRQIINQLWLFRIIVFSFTFLIVFLIANSASSAEYVKYVRVDAEASLVTSPSYNIEHEDYPCRFANDSDKDYFIPAKSLSEWNAFKSASIPDLSIDCDPSVINCTFTRSTPITNGYMYFSNFNMGAMTVELWGGGGGGQGGQGGSGWPGAYSGSGGLGGFAGNYRSKEYSSAPSYASITIGSGGSGGAGGAKNSWGQDGEDGENSIFAPNAPLIGSSVYGGNGAYISYGNFFGSYCDWEPWTNGCGNSGGQGGKGVGSWAYYAENCGSSQTYGAGGHGGEGGDSYSALACNAGSGSTGSGGSSGAIKLTYECIDCDTCPSLCIYRNDCPSDTWWSNWECKNWYTSERCKTTYSCDGNQCESSIVCETETCNLGCDNLSGECATPDCSSYYDSYECGNAAGCEWNWNTYTCESSEYPPSL